MKKQSMEVLHQDLVTRRVLITGVDGFTGIHLERLLCLKGFDVYGTVHNSKASKRHFACDITRQQDITNIIDLVRPDFIFHLAGIAFVGEQNSSAIYNVNILGTENLLNAIVKCEYNPLKVIIPSSASVYGNQNDSILDEMMCPKPTSHYGYSKLAVEHLCSTYFSDINIVITRPFNYTGPHQKENFLIPKIVNHYKNRQNKIRLGNINVAREFNHVNDVVNIYMKLMLSTVKSTVVNVCSGNATYLLEIVDILNKYAGYKMEILVDKKLVRLNEIEILRGSTTRLESLIDYSFKNNIENILYEMYNDDFIGETSNVEKK